LLKAQWRRKRSSRQKKGDFEAALAKADEHLAKIQEDNDPREIQDHHGLLGLIHFEKGDHTQAIEHLNQGDQEDPYTLYHLAVAESKAGDPARANELFSKVADMNQDLFWLWFGLCSRALKSNGC